MEQKLNNSQPLYVEEYSPNSDGTMEEMSTILPICPNNVW